MNKIAIFLTVVFAAALAHAVEMGVPIQLKLKNPSGVYPTDNNASFVVQILSPANGCVLREENFTSQNVVSGTISLALGSGLRSGYDPNISLTAVYDNSIAKNSLTCVDANNNVVSSGQTYNPAATDTRVLRVRATINAVAIVADFVQRAAPYAIHAESVGGKVAADILVQNAATSLNQSNLETLLQNATRFNKLQNLAVNGIADSATVATTAGTATNFSGSLSGDVTGIQSATVVGKLRGVTISTSAPSSGQVLAYDGSQYVPMTFVASAPVASVNGQTGAVVLNVSHIAGALSSSSALTGDVTGNASATVVSFVGGKTAAAVASAVNEVNAATDLSTANTIAKRDSSGNLTAASLLATNASTQNIYLYEGTNTNYVRLKAPNSFANYILTLPVDDGTSGQMLSTDGSGNLSWVAPGGITSSSIISALGYTPANSATVVLKSNNLSDLASATVARSNLGLGGAALLNVGTAAGTVAAGDDSRIVNALSTSTNFSGDVSGTYNSLALVNSGVTSGTYTKVTVNAKGLITSGTSLTSTDVTTALGYTPASATALSNYVTQSSFNAYVASASCTTSQSMYWNSVSSTFACQDIAVNGDISGIASSVTVTKVQGVGVSFSSLASNHILQYNGTSMVNRLIPTCSAGQYLTFNGTAWSCALDVGSGGIVSAITVAAPLQSTGGSVPTLSMPQATGSVSGYLTGTDWTIFNSKITSSTASIEQVLGFSPANSATILVKTNNLSDLADVATARTNLGLGTFATASTIDLGSASATGTLDIARLPAMTGDVTSVAGNNSITVAKIQGVAVSATAPTAGQVLKYDGTQWVPSTGLTQYGKVTSNLVIPNSTYVDVTNFTFPVVSGSTYKYRFTVVFSIASTTRSPRFLLSSPTATVIAAQAQVPYSTSVITNTIVAAQSGTATTAASNAVNGQVLIAIIEGIIVPSANGVVKLQASPSATANMTVYQGSTMEWTQVP